MNLTGELDLSKIIQLPLPDDQYYKTEHTKTQIVLHHSASGDNAINMIGGWKANKQKVATAFGMIDDGTVYQAFDEKYYASHVGYYIADANGKVLGGNAKAYKLVPGSDNRATNLNIEARTIGIEVCNWGSLTLKNGKFLAWPSKSLNPAFPSDVEVPINKVIRYPDGFRGFEYYERYTDGEIESLWKWIRHYASKYNIPAKFNTNIFDLNPDAINGVPGVYTHCQYRADKGDMPPQPSLVEMLKAL